MNYRRFAKKTVVMLVAVLLLLGNTVLAFAEAEGAGEAVTEEAEMETANTLAAGTDAVDAATADTPVEWPGFWDGVSADTACLMDADTGIVLYDKNMEQKMYPASVTKVMTTLLALEKGNLSDEVAMTPEGTQYAVSGSANLYTQVGEVFTLEQMLYGAMLRSANDIATQIGYHIGGNSLDTFYQMMNDRAASLGARNTHFHSACGMPDEEHWTCAYDLALIMSAAIKNDMFRTICQTKEYAIPPTNMNSETRMFASHNLLLMDENYRYEGLIGGKTGYTDAAQSTLVEAASRDGLSLVAVVLHEPDSTVAASDTIRMMDFGFANYQSVEVGKPEYTVYGGKALLPKGVSPDSLVLDEGEPYETEDGTFVRWEYLLDGRTVGFAVMTAADAEAYHVELFGPSATPSPEPTKATDKAESQSGTKDSQSAEEKPGQAETKKSGPFGILFMIFLVLAIAAAVSAVAFGVLLHRAKVEAEKARKEKMALRRRAMADEAARSRRETPQRNVRNTPKKGVAPRNPSAPSQEPEPERAVRQEGPQGPGPSPAVKEAAARYLAKQEERMREQERENES